MRQQLLREVLAIFFGLALCLVLAGIFSSCKRVDPMRLVPPLYAQQTERRLP